jgi:glyoxylase-like metal-dependent hydrolase (beta-lactamase superfamily II)
MEAGLAQMVDGTETIEEHLSLTPAPGHSPGHVLINLASQGQQAYFSGDIIHHAIQVYNPTWNSFACEDQPTARQSRRMTLEKCAGSGALLLPQHFGVPHICHVDHKGDAFVPRFVCSSS